jgi:hypothetical protein
MKFTTHQNQKINVQCTCLQGYIKCSYEKLCAVFGEPQRGDFDKSDAEWSISFPLGDNYDAIATIYNWKNGKNYCGAEGMDVEDITEWNVGGHSKVALYRVMEILEENPAHTDKTKLQKEIDQLKRQKECIMLSIEHERNRVILELKSAIKIINEL